MGTPPRSDLPARAKRALDLGWAVENFSCSDCIKDFRRSRWMGGIRVCCCKILLGFPATGAKPSEEGGSDVAAKNTQKKPHPCKKRKDGPPNFKSEEYFKVKNAASCELQMRGDGSGVNGGQSTHPKLK